MVPLTEVHNGDYLISSQLDVDALAGIRVVTGTLRITAPRVSRVSLPDLEVVGVNLFVEDGEGQLSELALPRLETVGRSFSISAPGAILAGLPVLDSIGAEVFIGMRGMTASTVPCLRSIAQELVIANTTELSALTFERLQAAQDVRVVNNAQLASFALPALERTRLFDVITNPKLVSLSAPALAQVEDLRIEGDPLLATLRFDQLATARAITLTGVADVNGFPALSAVTAVLVAGDTGASTLSTFGALQSVGYLGVYRNQALTRLGLSALTTVTGTGDGFGVVTNNPMLPTCEAVALANRVMREFQIFGNDDAGTCN